MISGQRGKQAGRYANGVGKMEDPSAGGARHRRWDIVQLVLLCSHSQAIQFLGSNYDPFDAGPQTDLRRRQQ